MAVDRSDPIAYPDTCDTCFREAYQFASACPGRAHWCDDCKGGDHMHSTGRDSSGEQVAHNDYCNCPEEDE